MSPFQICSEQKRKSSNRCSNSFRPSLEALEDRLTPSGLSLQPPTPLGTIVNPGLTAYLTSATASIQGNRVVVQGNGYDNEVEIWEDQDAGSIRLLMNGVREYLFSTNGIDRIDIDLGGGADWLAFRQVGDLIDARTIDVDPGNGADVVVFDFVSQTRIRAPLDLTVRGSNWFQGGRYLILLGEVENDVNIDLRGGFSTDEMYVFLGGDIEDGTTTIDLYGGAGNDGLSVVTGTPRQWGLPLEVDDDAVLDVNMHGGSHDDSMVFVFVGEFDGSLRLRMDGDSGNDRLFAGFALDSDSDGDLDAALFGGPGRDRIDFLFTNTSVADMELIQALVDGGDSEEDQARVTSEVDVRNVEFVRELENPAELWSEQSPGQSH